MPKFDDAFVYAKLERGEALSTLEEELALDGSSIENIIKQKFDNLILNEELNQYFKKEEEKKIALEMTLEGICEYMLWLEKEKAKEVQYYKAQQQSLEQFNLDENVIIGRSKDIWLENLKTLLPKDISYDDVVSKVHETAKQSNEPVDTRAINAVFELAKYSPTIRAFIFPPKDPDPNHDHCQLIAERIFHVGKILKHGHCHNFMNEFKIYLENESANKIPNRSP